MTTAQGDERILLNMVELLKRALYGSQKDTFTHDLVKLYITELVASAGDVYKHILNSKYLRSDAVPAAAPPRQPPGPSGIHCGCFLNSDDWQVLHSKLVPEQKLANALHEATVNCKVRSLDMVFGALKLC